MSTKVCSPRMLSAVEGAAADGEHFPWERLGPGGRSARKRARAVRSGCVTVRPVQAKKPGLSAEAEFFGYFVFS